MHNFYIGDLVKITPDGKKDFTAHRIHGFGLITQILPYGKYEIFFTQLGKARQFYYCDITRVSMLLHGVSHEAG